MLELANVLPTAIAAPLAFLAGVFVGLWVSSTFQLIRKHEVQELREHAADRDHSHDRPDDLGDV